MAVGAVAETTARAIVSVFQAVHHLFVAEGPDEVVEVPVCQAEEHGGGERIQVSENL